MEKLERYQELRTRLAHYERHNADLSAELQAVGATQETLRKEVLRAEVLGDSGWKDKKAEAERNYQRGQRLNDERTAGIRAVGILQEELDRIANEVAEDIRGRFRPLFEKAMRAFIGKLKDAAASEARVKDVLRECEETFAGLGIDRPLGIEWSGSAATERMDELVSRVVDRCKLNGIDVD